MDETSALREILLRLADDYDNGRRASAYFNGINDEETSWLHQTFAAWSSEGSITVSLGGGIRLTADGYQRYLPQIRVLRAREKQQESETSSASNLNVSLLYRIMNELGRLRGSTGSVVSTGSFKALLGNPGETRRDENGRKQINRHLAFLEESGFVRIDAKLGEEDFAGISLTLRGQTFVQPELAEFGKEPSLPAVVKSLEEQIEILTYPRDEKDGLLYRMREAIAKQAPDVIAKVIAEIGFKIMSGQK
jgi:hypothetical protein